MADIITSFFLTSSANGVAATQTKKLAPSALELGADNLTRNPRAETLGRLFSRPSSSVFASVESFLAVAKAGSGAARPAPNAAPSKAGAKKDAPAQNNALAQDLFFRRETSAEARLKELLKASSGSGANSGVPKPGSGEALNPAPKITRNSGLRVQEGGAGTINAQRLSSTDTGTAKQDIIFTIEDGPRHGRLERTSKPGQEVTSFTQADLDSGAVRYIHDGGETSADSFNFLVSDGVSETSGSFAISISSVNDAPEVAVNEGLTVDEGDAAAITTAQLSAFDPDTLAGNTVFEVVTGPSGGRLESTDDPGTAITSFTQADLQAGRVQYVNDGSETTADSFTFRVRDGAAATGVQTFNIGINGVDDAPEADANTGGTVAEGGTSTITSAQLNTTDVDTDAEDITYTVTSGPANGRLELSNNAGTAITSFTQADVNAELVRFVHDGSETTADSFSFAVSDGTTTLAANTFNFSVTAVDDPPVIAANTGLTVNEGGTGAITSAQLHTTDVDTAPQNITYTLTTGPAHGRVELSTNPGAAITSFTQADVNAGRVRFVHDGSETTSDNFTFSVSDGTTALSSVSFNVNVTPVNDAPVAAVNTGATVNEGSTTTITSAQLRTSDVDTAAANITYTVTAGPANGRLELSTNAGVAITSFTQADIDAGRLRYVHNGSETTTGSFTFGVSDGSAALPSATFNINVTPVNDAPTVVNHNGTVTEGGSVTLNTTHLNATDPDSPSTSLVYTVTSAPTTGRLERVGNPGVAITSFTQADIIAGQVRFVHAGGEAPTSTFGFSVSDGSATTTGNTFSFNVTPVNDPPVLATNAGLTLARGTSAIITSARLNTTDVDTAAANLTYTVNRAPTRGRLELTTNPGVSVTSFTQADIDAGRLRYVHTRPLSGTDDTFRFRVSDGTTQLANATFRITVT